MIDKTELLTPRLPEADVEIPGVGSVRIRSVTRAEVLRAQRVSGGDPEHAERVLLAAALVDPVLSEAEVERWQASASPAEVGAVSDAIGRLSGLTDGAAKAAYADFRDQL